MASLALSDVSETVEQVSRELSKINYKIHTDAIKNNLIPKELSKNHQIICITHLPQIAAMADNHYLIEKNAKDNKTVTEINKLNIEDASMKVKMLLSDILGTDEDIVVNVPLND